MRSIRRRHPGNWPGSSIIPTGLIRAWCGAACWPAGGCAPADCVIFEDARAGFEAAKRAGAGRIVALTTTLPREELERGPLADRIIDSFADIDDIDALLA